MKRSNALCQSGFTVIELLVSLVIVGVILVGSFAGFKTFSNAVQITMEENTALENSSIAITLLRQDLELSGWGLPTASRIAGEDSGGISINEATFSVDINGNGQKTDTINADLLYIADSTKIIRDSVRELHYPDGQVRDAIAIRVADAEEAGGQNALLESASAGSGSVVVSTTNVNYDTETAEGWYSGYNCNDIRANMAIILGGHTTAGGYAVEGHRISGVTTATGNAKCKGVAGSVQTGSSTVTFVSTANGGRNLGSSYKTNSQSFAVPSIAWYIRQADDGVYWLYRNNHRILANVVDFQVAYGVDVDQDGLEWSGTVVPGTSFWARPEHTLDYLASDDPASPIPVGAPNSGEVSNHLGAPKKVIESIRTVWVRLTILRHGAAEEDKEDNIVATSYVTMANLRN